MQSDSRTKEEAGPRPLGGAEFEPQESEVLLQETRRCSWPQRVGVVKRNKGGCESQAEHSSNPSSTTLALWDL